MLEYSGWVCVMVGDGFNDVVVICVVIVGIGVVVYGSDLV